MSNGTPAPTRFWYCDSCGKRIEQVEEGWVEWISFDVPGEDPPNRCRDLRLVHKDHFDPDKVSRCQFNQQAECAKDDGIVMDVALEHCLGPDGLSYLLSLVERDTHPRMDLLRMIMRLQVPGYEQAWRHIETAISDGVLNPDSEDGFLDQDDIQRLIDKYE